LIEFYDRGGGKDPNLDPLMIPLGLSGGEKAALAAFIKSLNSLNPEVADVKPIGHEVKAKPHEAKPAHPKKKKEKKEM